MIDGKPVFIDLDRTLFDTARFFDALWDYLESAYGLPGERQSASGFYDYYGELYSYDFYRHIQSLGLDAEEVTRQLLVQLPAQRFLFADAYEFLAARTSHMGMTILTFGGSRYQQLKIDLCAELAELPVIAVLEPKSNFLSTLDGPSIMIDDKLIADEMPPEVTFVHIDRSQPEAVKKHGHYISIRSLLSLEEALRS